MHVQLNHVNFVTCPWILELDTFHNLVKNVLDHITFQPCFKILNFGPNVICLAIKCQVIDASVDICNPSHHNCFKCPLHMGLERNEWINLKIIVRSTNISCNFASVNLTIYTIAMIKESWAYASFIKFLIAVNIKTMQARLNTISTSTKCSKLKATIWIVRLSNAIFSEWAQHGNLASLTSFKIFKPFVSIISFSLTSSRCLFQKSTEIFVNGLHNSFWMINHG